MCIPRSHLHIKKSSEPIRSLSAEHKTVLFPGVVANTVERERLEREYKKISAASRGGRGDNWSARVFARGAINFPRTLKGRDAIIFCAARCCRELRCLLTMSGLYFVSPAPSRCTHHRLKVRAEICARLLQTPMFIVPLTRWMRANINNESRFFTRLFTRLTSNWWS